MDANDVTTISEQEQLGVESQILRLKQHHALELENLSLSKHPTALWKLFKYFTIAVFEQVGTLYNHVARHRLSFLLTTGFILIAGTSLYTLDGPHEMYVKESLAWARYTVWWVALGVASSIGLGSGLHTFILYLGPHVTAFTMRATQCGRVDFKSAPYDTPQWGLHSTWATKHCSQCSLKLFCGVLAQPWENSLHTLCQEQVPFIPMALFSIIWLYFAPVYGYRAVLITSEARLSGETPKELEEQLVSTAQSFGARTVQRLKLWMVNHFENFGFFTILLLASVPNPMFDLAGILCGQFLVPFWKFFAATLIGKAIIKTHIQTIFIIMACNPYVLELVGDGLNWLIRHLPAVEHYSPNIIAALERAKGKLHNSHSAAKVPPKRSVAATAWNTVVLLMMAGFLSSIIKSAALNVLRERQSRELRALEARLHEAPSTPRSRHETNGQ